MKEYKLKNKEKYREYERRYRLKNKEKIREYLRKWRLRNKDKKNTYNIKYYQENTEKCLAYTKTEKGRGKRNESVMNNYYKFPEKWRCRRTARRLLKRGIIKRGPCETCDKKAEMHHEDYSKPEEVEWYCHKHHMQIEREKRENENQDAKN